jgi:translocation and assembly module TamB
MDTPGINPTHAAPARVHSPRLLPLLLATALALMLVGMGSVAALAWALRSESGTAWLVAHLPGIEVVAPRGRLWGDFDARQVRIRFAGGRDQIAIGGLAWRGLKVEAGSSGRWLHLAIDELRAARVDLQLLPDPKAAPLQPPADLALPLELEVHSLRIDTLSANALGEQPVRDLQAQVHLGAGDGSEHRIDGLSLAWDRLSARGQAHIAAAAPMALEASIQLRQEAGSAAPEWNAQAALSGPLAAPRLQASLRAQPSASRPAQVLDAHATLHPFAAWPLTDLQASARGLDLSAFSSAAPVTTLALDATASNAAAGPLAGEPVAVSLQLTNSAAGRWNEGRLPLRSLQVELRARPDDTSKVELRTFAAELGNGETAAGRISGQGRWTRSGWALETLLKDVQPAGLDARAPSMSVGGSLHLAGSGFDAGARIDVTSRLDGQWTATGPERVSRRTLQLALDARLSALEIEVRQARAASGSAHADVTGRVTRSDPAAPWQVDAQAALVDFDPSTWWPGRDGSAWRAGPHRLNAKAEIRLGVPTDAATRAPLALLGALAGTARLHIGDSLLAGVPLHGDLLWNSRGDGNARPSVDLDAAGNQVHLEGHLAARAADDAWDLRLAAPALDRLKPLARLFQAGAGDTAFAGSLNLDAHATGRWPEMSTRGRLEGDALALGGGRIRHASADWQLGTRADAAVDAELTLSDASLQQDKGQGAAAGPSVETLQLQLKGTGRAHTLDVIAKSRALPPAWTDALQAAASATVTAAAALPASAPTPAMSASAPVPGPGATRTLAHLQMQGGLVGPGPGTAGGWQGQVQQLDLRSSAVGATALLSSHDVGIALQWQPTLSVALQPGRAEVLGAALRWSRIAWQAGGNAGPAAVDAEVELEAFPVAPLLARLQPGFGWGGDLAVTGHVKLHSAPTFSADVVLERSRGDLSVTDEYGSTALGLSDLRLGLAASEGVWNFTQALAGKTLGVAAGAVVARTTPEALWPGADTPVEGVLELQVANLGTWGTWVPAGWRLDGALHANATIGGRFGAPEYTGQIQGSGLGVRNFLQGVNVSEGEVSISLQGARARIESFHAKAGDGSLKLEGEASLGEAPKALLQLTAAHFQLLGRVDRRIVASGQARLRLDRDQLALDGRFDVDEGLIDFTRSDAPALSDDVVVVRRKPAPLAPGDEAGATPSTSAPAANRKVALDLRVDLGQKLRVRGRGLDTGLRGELHITSPEGRLAVDGTVRTADGTYAAYGQKLQIDRGLITFSGATDNPRLDIEATRPNLDVRVGVLVSGTTLNPRVRLFSEPDLSDVDKLSWLVMGRASDGLGRTDTALLQRAALALLAGEGTSPTDQLTKAIGLDEVSLKQSDGEVKETVIALGKQLSRRLYVGYERGLNATGGSWQLIYRIAQRFTLRAQSGLDNSLDLIWTWRWQ